MADGKQSGCFPRWGGQRSILRTVGHQHMHAGFEEAQFKVTNRTGTITDNSDASPLVPRQAGSTAMESLPTVPYASSKP